MVDTFPLPPELGKGVHHFGGGSHERHRAREDRGPSAARWSLILVTAQVADVLTTRVVLAAFPRATEANPLIAAAQTHFGPAWWLPKLAVASALVLLVRYRPRRRLVVAIGLASTAPVLVNLTNLLAGMTAKG